jgi:site-specific recombinase XerD
VKYILIKPSAHALWHASTRNHVGALVGVDDLGDLVLAILTGSLATSTCDTYGTEMRCFTTFCDEEGITPLHIAAAGMLRFTTWLARAGTIAVSSLQPYFSTINKSFRDHLRSKWRGDHF